MLKIRRLGFTLNEVSMTPIAEISQSTLDMLNDMSLEISMRFIDLLEHAMADFHRVWRLEGAREQVRTVRVYRRKLEGEEASYTASTPAD